MGEKFSGVIFDVNPLEAFVDIGAEEHGLLPARLMSKDWVDPVSYLAPGDRVEVWVSSTDRDGSTQGPCFTVTLVKELIEKSDVRAFQGRPLGR